MQGNLVRALVRQGATALLLVALLLQTFSQIVIAVDFYANQAAIARTLCVNRDKPMMHCNGRCQLCKRLAQDNNDQRSAPEKRSEDKNQLLFPGTNGIVIAGMRSSPLRHAPCISDNSTLDRAFFCFHPPD